MAGLNLPIVEPARFQVEEAEGYDGATTQQAGLNKPALLLRGSGFLVGLAGFMLIAAVVFPSPLHAESPSSFSLASFIPGMRGTKTTSAGQAPVMQMRSPMERIARIPTVPLRNTPPAMRMPWRAAARHIGMPPPGSGLQPLAPVSMISRMRGPMTWLTLSVVVLVLGWQSKKAYKARQERLLEEYGATMVAYLGREDEMASTLKHFRRRLGPGSYSVPMFVAFIRQMADNRRADIKTILDLKRAVAIMQMTPSALIEALPLAMDGRQEQPTVLGKIVFVTERAVPAAAQAAQLRSKFPTWSPEIVEVLQRATLENLYRDMLEKEDVDADSAENLAILGLTEDEASRLRRDVDEKKAAAAAAQATVEEEARARDAQEAAVKKASEYKPRVEQSKYRKKKSAIYGKVDEEDADDSLVFSVGEDEDEDEDEEEDAPADRGDGTHEYECTKCGYTMFAAAGREFKFYGDNFTCPTCGADKSAFVDNA